MLDHTDNRLDQLFVGASYCRHLFMGTSLVEFHEQESKCLKHLLYLEGEQSIYFCISCYTPNLYLLGCCRGNRQSPWDVIVLNYAKVGHVAQRIRASDSGSEGRRFESCRARTRQAAA